MGDEVKKAIATDLAPSAIGLYSQAVVAGGMLYCSGQIALDPKTGEIVSGGVGPEVRRVLENLKGALAGAGLAMDSVVKTTVYLKDMSDFAKVNAIYGEYFTEPYPARATVEVARLPKDALVEIDALAVL